MVTQEVEILSPIQTFWLMTLDVVILNWNGRKLLEILLPRVAERSAVKGVTLVLADNGSDDDSVEWVKTNMPDVKIIELGQNYGFADGYNRALALLESDYCLLLNSDVEPAENWLPPLIRVMDENSEVAAVTPKIKDYNNRQYFEYAGAAGGYIDKLGYTFCRGRIFDNVEEDRGQYDTPSKVFWGSGAALLVRRKLFLDSGGFDSHFIAHMEEVDWCWRIKNRGYEILYEPSSEVYHMGGGSLNYGNPRKTYLNFRNNLFLILKNQYGTKAWLIIAARFVLDFVALLNFFFKGEGLHAAAISKAHRNFLKDAGRYKAIRKQLMRSVIARQHPEQYRGSVVLDYFLKGKKEFKMLRFKPDPK